MNWFLVKNKTDSMVEALSLYKEARAPRDYKREYAQYHSKPERVAERSTRNKARRKLGLTKGDPREVDHKIPLSRGGSNARSNLRAVSLQANRKKFTKTAFDSDALTARILNALAARGVKSKDDRPMTKAERRYFNKRFKGKKTEKRLTKTANDKEKTYAEMRDAIRSFSAKQNIDPEKAMLVAGGAGYMHGMRDEVNDLDFFHDDLPDFVQEPYGRFDMDGGPGKDLPDAAKQYQMMHGMRVQTPEAMLAFYQRLNRPKDQEKIKMLQAHLKTAGTATKTNPGLWEKSKQQAKGKMDGKHSARAMQLATKIYKSKGGGYSGAKPSSKTNSLKKWSKQDWGYSGKDKPGQGGSGVYLPKKKRERLKATEQGRKQLAAATRKKHKATAQGKQYSSHGLAANTSLKQKKR